jgi:glutamine synthetase type III
LPACLVYQTKVATNIHSLMQIGLPQGSYQSQTNLLNDLSNYINIVASKTEQLEKAIEFAHHQQDCESEADIFCNTVKPLMEEIRNAVDF